MGDLEDETAAYPREDVLQGAGERGASFVLQGVQFETTTDAVSRCAVWRVLSRNHRNTIYQHGGQGTQCNSMVHNVTQYISMGGQGPQCNTIATQHISMGAGVHNVTAWSTM